MQISYDKSDQDVKNMSGWVYLHKLCQHHTSLALMKMY